MNAESAAFVLCIENNETRAQALLLIESIREFGGRFAASPIVAVAPRAGLGVDAPTRGRLESLEVSYHEEPLNTVCPEYGSANRVYTAAWAARNCRADTLFVLDSDTLFLAEPEPLGSGWDLAVRPVDVQGSTTGEGGNAFTSYWAAVCDMAGITIESLPFVETVLDRFRVRASYNGGYSVVRRASGILERAAELFTRSVESDLRPYKGVEGHRIFASTGHVSPLASEYWGSNQAALAITAWSTTQRVRLLDRRFNVPLHGLANPVYWSDDWLDLAPVHLHYHWMLRASDRRQALRTMARMGVPADRLEWIAARTPLDIPQPGPAPAIQSCRDRPLLICGMHRSATSLVASVFEHAGVWIGRDLFGPDPGNPHGYFEDREVWQLHEELLSAAGTTALLASDDLALPAGAGLVLLQDRARALIERRRAFGLWGFKDPRTCLFLDFWNALLPDARYLFLYRHPIEVALSLRRRASDLEVRIDPWTGIRAWEVYNRRLLDFVERHPERCFLAQVPALTLDLQGFVRRVGAGLDLPLEATDASARFSPADLVTSLESENLSPAWEELLPAAMAMYRRLEAKADLPARKDDRPAAEKPGAAAREAIEALFQDLLRASREAPGQLRSELAEAVVRRDELLAALAPLASITPASSPAPAAGPRGIARWLRRLTSRSAR